MKTEDNQISLQEFLVKTSYQTQTTLSTDKQCENPLAFGSGFIVKYKNELFFVTADHTLHLEDYKKNKRTGIEYVVSIFNNYTPPDNYLSTILTPLGDFHYMEQFNLDKPDSANELIDITLCKLKNINLQYPFLCDDSTFNKHNKLSISVDCFSEPQIDKDYLIFGQIKTRIEGIQVLREKTLKEKLRFKSKNGDYFLFNTPKTIIDSEEWEGLSGSPVISEDGHCVGVLCSVNQNSKSIWVMPIAKVNMLLEIAIQQEKLETLNLKK
ncbi:hypothetical protein [Flavobacterium inviolabile]|uniref:hypothetical protein n=1 Tax=Flavobacterium inviolabile TaxID=2748320 RepID=UPI0015A8F467|nr:hypothetical protein [Flavobacterium inviolabile]